jgi:hypothetical protein
MVCLKKSSGRSWSLLVGNPNSRLKNLLVAPSRSWLLEVLASGHGIREIRRRCILKKKFDDLWAMMIVITFSKIAKSPKKIFECHYHDQHHDGDHRKQHHHQ